MYANCLTADSELNACFDTAVSRTDAWQPQDRFATMPAITAVPAYQPPSEEELHTSFEQAISDRLLVINRQLSIISGPLAQTQGLPFTYHLSSGFLNQSDATTFVKLSAVPVQLKPQPALPANAWQRKLVFGCLALMFILIGFDLMGLLMLYIR